MMNCTACGAEMLRRLSACPACGHPNHSSATTSPLSRGVAIVLCLFFGGLGIHRFYTGHMAIGVIYLFTLGLCWCGALFDLVVLLTGNYRDSHGRRLE